MRGPLLWLRALLLGAVAVLAGTVAHAEARGHLPDVYVVAGLVLAGATVAAPLLRRQASTRRLVTMLVLGQSAVHLVLTGLGGHEGDEPDPAGHGPAFLHHLTEDLTGPHALMALAHAGAAALVGLWLAVGERALFALLRYAGRLVPRRARPVVVPRRVRWVPVPTLARPLLRALDSSVRRRGPPCPVSPLT